MISATSFQWRKSMVVFIFFLCFLRFNSSHPTPMAFLARLVQNKPHNNHDDAVCEGLLTLRTGGLTKKRGVVWHYKGILRNPINGAVIVGIEGLELTRRLSPLEMNNTSLHTNKSTTVTPLSFLSRKVFVYTELQNRSAAMTKFRSGKHAPLRPLNPARDIFERVTIGQFDGTNGRILGTKSNTNETTTSRTVGEALPTSVQRRRTDSGRYIADVELSGGRHLRTDKLSISRQHDGLTSSYLMNVMHRLLTGTMGQYGMQYNVVNFVRGRPKKLTNKWISFASPSDLITSGRSQEYYTVLSSGGRGQQGQGLEKGQGEGRIEKRQSGNVTMVSKGEGKGMNKWWSRTNKHRANQDPDHQETSLTPTTTAAPRSLRASVDKYISQRRKYPQGDASMKYTRYGEGPSWYSIGRPVASEIEATRYNSLADTPLYVRQLIQEQCPTFFTDADGIALPIGDPLATSKVLTMENFARQKSEMGQFLPLYKQVLNKAASLIWKSKDRQ